MDELEKLKQNWKKQEDTLPVLSYDQLYKMHLKKSSSIVQWIFIISILEFVLWTGLDIIMKLSGNYDNLFYVGSWLSVSTSIISYGILIYFVIQFYRSYTSIQTTDSFKMLMESILKTRKTVRQYVLANVLFFAILGAVTILFTVSNHPDISVMSMDYKVLFVAASLVVILLIIGFIFVFYRVIYGVLTRKLQKNYEELKEVEL